MIGDQKLPEFAELFWIENYRSNSKSSGLKITGVTQNLLLGPGQSFQSWTEL
jgi:hypothetical protein